MMRRQQSFQNLFKLIEQNPEIILSIYNPTDEMYVKALRKNGMLLKDIKKQTYKMVISALKNNPMAIQFVINATSDLNLQAVSINGLALEHINNQNYRICLQAVEQNGLSLQYSKLNCPMINLKAIDNIMINRVEKNKYIKMYFEHSLTHIKKLTNAKNPTPELCVSIIKDISHDIDKMMHTNPHICERFYKQSESNVDFIKSVCLNKLFSEFHGCDCIHEYINGKVNNLCITFVKSFDFIIDQSTKAVKGDESAFAYVSH